jgi:TRAP-type C4-dicarboxylate transport system permease small subunit
LVRFLELWQRIEVRLVVLVVVAEISALSIWVALKSFAAYYTPGGNLIGVIFRGIVGAILLGLIAHFALRKAKLPELTRRWIVVGAIGAGLLFGRAWANAGGEWASNASSWIQNASALALIGGPRGLVTRLTLWLALLGASIAAGLGKHINIDVAVRYLPKKMIQPVALLGWALAAVVCLLATFGFVDSIAVTKYRAEAFTSCPQGLCDTPLSQRLATVARGTSVDLFMLRKQLLLDLRTLPRVIAGSPYDRWLTAKDWNEFVAEGGFEDYFPPEAVEGLKLTGDPNATRMPAIVDPTTGEGRNRLIRDLDFILPFGLLMIALKFLLRIVLVLRGQVKIEGEHA